MHDSMEEFIQLLRGTDKAEGTVTAYESGLDQFSDWLSKEEVDPREATARDIKRYLSFLKSETGYAHKTIRLRYSAVSEYYRDLTDAYPDLEDPTDDVRLADYAPETTRREEVAKEERVWLTKDEVRRLVENVPAPKLRNRLFILFQYFTGLRVGEVSDVKLADIDRETRQVQVRGKNDKTHTAHWQPKLDGLLTAWLDGGYRSGSPYARESEYLFLSSSGPQLSGEQMNNVVVTAAENAGIQEVLYEDARGFNQNKVTSHALRHSFAMHWLENGGSIEALSKHMAHSSVTTTEVYGEILEERAKEEYQEYAPNIDF